jgi:exonuclease SbcC
MRILAIRGENLASLARSFEIDLVRGPLAGAGIFAIIGPVGAGKSTLLDALCLPLFDRTPRLSGRGGAPVGDDSDDRADWLRAHDPRTLLRRDAGGARAEVDFVGRDGVRYRASWSVRRARRRADGRVQDQELLLTDLDRGAVVASGRRSDVLAAVQQRLGLDFAQFCRSVLLAQGDFAAFLRASADERARLLETLTGADVYRRLSKAAHERARGHERELALLQAQAAAQAPLDDAERQALEAAAGQLAAQRATCAIAIELATRYVNWHAAAEQHRCSESEGTVALQKAIEANAQAAPRRDALLRRQRALAVVPRWEVAAAAEREAAATRGTAAAAAGTCERAADATRIAGQRLRLLFASTFGSGAPAAVPALVRELPQWEPLLQQWAQAELRLAPAEQALPAHERAAVAAAAQRDEAAAASAPAAAAVAAAKTALEAAQARAERIDAEALVAERRELERARERLAQQRVHAGLTELRAQLVAGEPCPLCGATEHAPLPARAAGDLAAADRALAAKWRELEAAEAEARGAAVALQGAVRASAAAGAAAHAVEQRRSQAEQSLLAAVRAGDAARAAAAAERTRIADVQQALAAACEGLPGGAAAVASQRGERLARLRSLHALHAALAQAERTASEAKAEAERAAAFAERAAGEAATASRALAKMLAAERVALEDVAATAELGAGALAEEARALRELGDAVERCRTILQERVGQRRRHEDHERPTLDAADAAAALREARANAELVEKREREIQVQLGADDVVRRHRAELAPRLAAAERALATWGALDGLIGSSTGDEFAVFAQGLTLDLLLVEANRRLAELARRYRLQRNPEAALDFVVEDLDLGGARRSLQTLSGGETFLVSLAMALALATLAAPKARVETLFLDEGFGTLDAQCLEVALGALDSLQATGCQIGVISHVDGIAERIGAQVVVQPEGGGQSRVSVHAR